jgi:ATP-dependent Clp protease ATP-binding subunit ClpA
MEKMSNNTPLPKGGSPEGTGGSKQQGTSQRTSPTPSRSQYGTGSSKGGNRKGEAVDLEKDIMPLLSSYFKPEFINRLDDIVLFNPISTQMLFQIVDLQIHQYQTMISKEK